MRDTAGDAPDDHAEDDPGAHPGDVADEPAPGSFAGPGAVDPDYLGPGIGFGLGAGTMLGVATGEYLLWLALGLLAGLVLGLAGGAAFGGD